jgi:glycosyltransferase involved in cell wall biosynthesis
MVKVIDLNYYAHLDFAHPEQVKTRFPESFGFITFLEPPLHLEVIQHLNQQGHTYIDGVKYSFFKKKNRFWSIPFKTHRYLKKQAPDVILVQGLIFPLQVIFLRLTVGTKSKILAQHHGESPYTGLKALLQKLADRYIDGYIFTAAGNAGPWVQARAISSWSKCHEVLEASTYLQQADKQLARKKLSMAGDANFLWVGRLNANKDPLTVLRAFRNYRQLKASARLFMIYQEEDLLPEIKRFIEANPGLEKGVSLMGRRTREELVSWYSAADFYISASHKEGSGYALLEAMACGCVPVVTDIPPFRKLTGDGKLGLLFKAGDPESLLSCLETLAGRNMDDWSAAIRQHFAQELTFKAIAGQLSAVIFPLVAK